MPEDGIATIIERSAYGQRRGAPSLASAWIGSYRMEWQVDNAHD
jgi:hypothetical protein